MTGSTGSPRAPACRPSVVLLDVFETTLALDGVRERMVEHGRPAHEFDVFFARVLRDGMAQSLAGRSAPFLDLARAQLRTTSGLVGADGDDVLAAFRGLRPHPDVEPGLQALASAGVGVWAFTHGAATVAEEALAEAGLGDLLAGVLSTEVLHTFKPPAAAYQWGCAQAGSVPPRTALLAAHSWDTHGAVSAGLVAGLITRLEGWVNEAMATPHVHAETFEEVVSALLALPESVAVRD